jgi:competence protein ComEC
MVKFSSRKVFIFLGILFFLNILAWSVVFDFNQPKFLEVNFFDVGQGDAILIETPKYNQILIDGGPDSKILEKLGKVLPFWDRDIDLIILSHPEKDHFAGLIEVFKKYKVNSVLWTGVVRDAAEYEEWEKLLEKEKAKIYIAQAGQKIKEGDEIEMDILFPLGRKEGEKLENSNDTSIVANLIFNKNNFLFTGDISQLAEKEILSINVDIASDVLKVAHHGSKNSSSEEFLKATSPQIAVISVGKNNSYGHPTQEVLKNIAKYGIKVLRTDERGDIKIISDGENLKVK